MLVTVDDDPGVSRAVARDLRRRYGEHHRIVRAESGDTALEALRQMKLRGDQVAVLLADYRMPGMTGIEFLERAMDVYPYAKRILLTAYADTSAAIDAINIVDLDHYLLKPWDPPEEKLYPVIDDLLRAWQDEDRKPVREAKLVGHRWSAPSTAMRDFLARNQVPYRWYASDSDEGRRLLEAAGADGRDLPVLITTEGEPMIAPSQAEVASRVGPGDQPRARLLRPGRGRRRPGRARGGGLRRLRGAAHGAGGEVRHRRPGRPVLQDRELPRLPRRPVRRPADRPGPAAGGQVRRRAADHQGGGRPGGQRAGQDAPARRRHRDRREGDHPRHRGGVPPAQRPRLRRDDRGRHLLRRGADRGRGVQGRRRVHRRRGQLGRPGRRLPGPVRPLGDHAGARRLARAVDVVLPDPADRRDREHLRPHLHRGHRGAAATVTSSSSRCAT